MTQEGINSERVDSLPEQMQFRLDKLRKLEADGQSPYLLTTCDVSNHAAEVIEEFERFEGKTISVAGRLLGKRGMGKVSFADLLDRTGTIQIFSRLDNLGEDSYAQWQNLDIGDIVAVSGEVFRTRTGRSPFATRPGPCSLNHCAPFLRNFMVFATRTCVIVSAILI